MNKLLLNSGVICKRSEKLNELDSAISFTITKKPNNNLMNQLLLNDMWEPEYKEDRLTRTHDD